MGKVLFCVALTACLLASAHPFIIGLDLLAPVTGVVNGLTNTVANTLGTVTNTVGTLTNVTGGLTGSLGAVTGIVGSLTGTVTNLTGGLTGTVTNLLNPVLQIVNSLTGTAGGLTNSLNIGGLADTVGNTLQTALSVPLNVVTGLAGSITGSLNPAKLVADITGVLKPTLDALTSVTNQLNGTGAVGCLLNSATGLIKGAVFTSVGEVLTCATPVTNVVKDLTKDVTNITTNGINFPNQFISKVTNCIQQSAASANAAQIISCVIQAIPLATNILSDATPLVSKTLSSALQVPTCATNVLTNTLNKTTDALQSIVQCAAGKGVGVTLPNLTNLLPNVTAIAIKAISAIEDIFKSTVGPTGPVVNLLQTLEQFKGIANTLTPNALNALNTTIQSVQEIINLAAKVAGGNLKALACVADAQKVLTDLAPEAVNTVVSCTVNLTKDTASLAAQAVAFDIGLKTDLLSAGANALAKCFLSIASLGDAVEKCFDAAVSEVQTYVKGQLAKINNAVDTAQSLIDNAQSCLNNVITRTTAVGQMIVAKQKACLAEQSITLPTNDITSVLVSGKAGIEKVVLGLSGALNNVSSTSVNVQASFDLISSVNKTAVETVVKGQISASLSAVLQIEAALKDNTNPAVKACIDSTKDKLSKLETSAVTSVLNCVAPLKDKISALAAQAVAEDLALKEKLANAAVKAEQQCSTSVSTTIAQQCFVNVDVNLNADVKQTVQKVQQLSTNAAQLVSDASKCVSDNAVKIVEAELAALSSCLAAQGITVQFTRS